MLEKALLAAFGPDYRGNRFKIDLRNLAKYLQATNMTLTSGALRSDCRGHSSPRDDRKNRISR